jgi:hypothetical protein
MRWQTLIGLGAGLLVAGTSVTSLVGCSNSAPSATGRPAVASLKPGVNLIDASDAKWGFNAAYVTGGRVVYIESRVGTPKPEVYQQNFPDQPVNQMDLRFVDGNNHTFFAQRGGDSWVDPSWAAEIAQSKDPTAPQPSLAASEQSWADAHEAAAALTAALPATFKDHVFHLNAFAAVASPGNRPELMAKVESAPPVGANGTQAYGSYTSGSATQLTYVKDSMSLDVAGSHSGVMMYINPNVGAWTVTINACNHGPCPSGGGWAHSCASPNTNWFSSASVNGSTTTNDDGANDGQGGCQTAYNWDSGNGSHLCNDDAAYEMWQSNNGNQNSPTGFTLTTKACCEGDCCGSWCSSYSCPSTKGSSHYACNCANNSGCSGDWATPNCF